METYSENTVAIIRGDCCTRSSGIKLNEFVLQPAIQKVYDDVAETTEQLEEHVAITLDEYREKLKDYTKLLSIIVPLANRPQCSSITQIENPEWKYVLVDGEDKILCSISIDDIPIFYATPTEILDCINAYYDASYIDLYQTAVSLAMSKLPFSVSQNPEWRFVICDAEDKIVMGIRSNNTPVLYISPEELWNYVVESLE